MNNSKKEIEIKSMDDVHLLPAAQQTKWEIANELGYFDKIVQSGWKSLTSREMDGSEEFFPRVPKRNKK